MNVDNHNQNEMDTSRGAPTTPVTNEHTKEALEKVRARRKTR